MGDTWFAVPLIRKTLPIFPEVLCQVEGAGLMLVSPPDREAFVGYLERHIGWRKPFDLVILGSLSWNPDFENGLHIPDHDDFDTWLAYQSGHHMHP